MDGDDGSQTGRTVVAEDDLFVVIRPDAIEDLHVDPSVQPAGLASVEHAQRRSGWAEKRHN
jgi:hypothetical protein